MLRVYTERIGEAGPIPSKVGSQLVRLERPCNDR